mmetsp:Transcript_1803/g.5613  ORF Transcript_1803/g.5613 Transcript_1803/m.5613 type:complete len:411 (+) Transcript_1803:290-1522(+)
MSSAALLLGAVACSTTGPSSARVAASAGGLSLCSRHRASAVRLRPCSCASASCNTFASSASSSAIKSSTAWRERAISRSTRPRRVALSSSPPLGCGSAVGGLGSSSGLSFFVMSLFIASFCLRLLLRFLAFSTDNFSMQNSLSMFLMAIKPLRCAMNTAVVPKLVWWSTSSREQYLSSSFTTSVCPPSVAAYSGVLFKNVGLFVLDPASIRTRTSGRFPRSAATKTAVLPVLDAKSTSVPAAVGWMLTTSSSVSARSIARCIPWRGSARYSMSAISRAVIGGRFSRIILVVFSAPRSTAQNRGVRPSSVTTLTCTGASSRRRAILLCPLRHATHSGLPFSSVPRLRSRMGSASPVSCWIISAQSTSLSTTSTWPFSHATNSAARPAVSCAFTLSRLPQRSRRRATTPAWP